MRFVSTLASQVPLIIAGKRIIMRKRLNSQSNEESVNGAGKTIFDTAIVKSQPY
ncbi:hypothetical protein ABES25_07475 [Bacillus gobiensis]|uniref:hypothetical protein n=1 Tax=Bacillus gobiensis TaxID=1441095 RepID=UPI003D1ED531